MSRQSGCDSQPQTEGQPAVYRGRIRIETIIFDRPYPTIEGGHLLTSRNSDKLAEPLARLNTPIKARR